MKTVSVCIFLKEKISVGIWDKIISKLKDIVDNGHIWIAQGDYIFSILSSDNQIEEYGMFHGGINDIRKINLISNEIGYSIADVLVIGAWNHGIGYNINSGFHKILFCVKSELDGVVEITGTAGNRDQVARCKNISECMERKELTD
jgi:hypothetical protein